MTTGWVSACGLALTLMSCTSPQPSAENVVVPAPQDAPSSDHVRDASRRAAANRLVARLAPAWSNADWSSASSLQHRTATGPEVSVRGCEVGVGRWEIRVNADAAALTCHRTFWNDDGTLAEGVAFPMVVEESIVGESLSSAFVDSVDELVLAAVLSDTRNIERSDAHTFYEKCPTQETTWARQGGAEGASELRPIDVTTSAASSLRSWLRSTIGSNCSAVDPTVAAP